MKVTKKKTRNLIERYLAFQHRFEKRHPILNSILVLFAVVLLWRGVWGLLDTYLFPDNPTLSYIISVTLALLILFLDDFELSEL